MTHKINGKKLQDFIMERKEIDLKISANDLENIRTKERLENKVMYYTFLIVTIISATIFFSIIISNTTQVQGECNINGLNYNIENLNNITSSKVLFNLNNSEIKCNMKIVTPSYMLHGLN